MRVTYQKQNWIIGHCIPRKMNDRLLLAKTRFKPMMKKQEFEISKFNVDKSSQMIASYFFKFDGGNKVFYRINNTA
jgi:hypothetical protein